MKSRQYVRCACHADVHADVVKAVYLLALLLLYTGFMFARVIRFSVSRRKSQKQTKTVSAAPRGRHTAQRRAASTSKALSTKEDLPSPHDLSFKRMSGFSSQDTKAAASWRARPRAFPRRALGSTAVSADCPLVPHTVDPSLQAMAPQPALATAFFADRLPS